MTQFFNRKQAENFRSDVMKHFPELHVDGVLDVRNATTKAYERSFFSVNLWDGTDILHSVYVNSEEDWNGMLLFSQYIASTIADNQQSEEEDSKEPHGKWHGDFDPANYVDTLPEF